MRLAMCAPAAMPSPDSTMQPSITPSPSARAACDHPHRLADAARLRELDVDAVRALGARGDVGERVAVLVDVDRDGRAALQLRPARVAGGSGCSQYSSRICGRSSSASSSVQSSFTSTCSGRSVAAAHRAHALERRGRRGRRASASAAGTRAAAPSRRGAPCRRGRRARPSTTSAGRRAAGRAACRPGSAGELALQVVERSVDARRARRARPAAAPPRSRRAPTGRRRARRCSSHASADAADSS